MRFVNVEVLEFFSVLTTSIETPVFFSLAERLAVGEKTNEDSDKAIKHLCESLYITRLDLGLRIIINTDF